MPLPDCGNPLLLAWMEEWMNEARAMQAKAFYTYKKAYESLRTCPTPFRHPHEAQQLNGIGPALASRLEKKMIEHCQANGLPLPVRQKPIRKRGRPTGNDTRGESSMSSVVSDTPSTSTSSSRPPQRRRVNSRPYVPRYRSGPYAILRCLLDFKDSGFDYGVKEDIIRHGQCYCDSSFDMPDQPGNNYTAWSSVRNLKEKGLVWQRGTPPRFYLTEAGLTMAQHLRLAGDNPTSLRPPDTQSASSSSAHPALSNLFPDDSSSPSPATPLTESAHQLGNPDPIAPASSATIISGRRTTTVRLSDQRQPSHGEPVDLSLYVLDPGQYRRDHPTSTPSSSATSRPLPNPSPRLASSAATTTIINGRRTTTVRLSDEQQRADNNADVDLSLYVLDPSQYGPSSPVETRPSASMLLPRPNTRMTASSPATQRQGRRTTTTVRLSDQQLASNNADLSLYVTDPAQFTREYQAQHSSAAASPGSLPDDDLATQQSLIDTFDDDEGIDLTRLGRHDTTAAPPSNEGIITLLSPSPPPATPTRSTLPPTSSASAPRLGFRYTFLDADDEPVRFVSKAAVQINDDKGCLMYKIRYDGAMVTSKDKAELLFAVDDRDCTAYLLEHDVDPICPGLPTPDLMPTAPAPAASTTLVKTKSRLEEEWDLFSEKDDDDDSAVPPVEGSQGSVSIYILDSPSPRRAIDPDSPSRYPSSPFTRLSSSQPVRLPSSPSRVPSSPPKRLESTQPTRSPAPQTSVTQWDLTSLHTSGPIETNTQAISPVCPELIEQVQQQARAWSPSDYEVLMVLDNREVKMKTNRVYIQERLAEKGVNVVTRSLDLGDVLWVARHRQTQEELYLDHIIERKRLDDLLSSIKDGRFDEQKNRLEKSASRKVFYVVEDYNKEAIMLNSWQTVQSALSSIQAINRFYLKRTSSLDDTIDYLVRLTGLVQQFFKGKVLHEIPARLITKDGYIAMKQALKEATFLVSFDMFGQLNHKYATSTLRDLYIRMLMTIRGVSAEKALTLAKTYPTPHRLLAAMNEISSEKDGKALAQEATKNETLPRRRWTKKMSERLWYVWGQQDA
ncbi:hypothetical protein DM01DRAFT_1327920 [Hesseltinella vesiculosa]|uniref:Crossover junction endonuclease MUS81 n=1 Tax=Hesseltinella vesiculosa TaxID=101127 RepID=A0A1X2G616_9FUNG|nr:hypothetical protein DM01DRAFT_1327920 [Hesseltinella vesiculosa]